MSKPQCEYCHDTGYYGDLGPGIRGNREWMPCDMCDATPQKELNPYEIEIERLKDLIARAAPLAWVFRREDEIEKCAEDARQWEVEAARLLKG